MMRETKTLKGLFADPQPPCRKNFIKENVKSLRQIEKLVHSNDKGLKLRPSKTIKISKKHNSLKKNRTFGQDDLLDSNAEENDSELTKLINRKLNLESLKNLEKNASGILNKKTIVKKITKSSVSDSTHNQHSHINKDQVINQKTEPQQDLKSPFNSNDERENSKATTYNSEHVNCKSQGVQTVDTKDIDSIYSEGVIRYPSGKTRGTDCPKLDIKDMTPEQNNAVKNDSDNSFQFSTRTNKEPVSVASRLAPQISNNNNGAPPPSYRKGVVPKYIKERKEAMQKEQLAKIAEKQSDCPKGHLPLPDNERKETLSVLKKNYQEFVYELNALPIRTDTLRSQKRKMEIEKQLAKLEEAIKVFSRPKVFVKIDS